MAELIQWMQLGHGRNDDAESAGADARAAAQTVTQSSDPQNPRDGGRGREGRRVPSGLSRLHATEGFFAIRAGRLAMKWLMEFSNEGRGVLARYDIEAPHQDASGWVLHRIPAHSRQGSADVARADAV